MQPFFFGDTEKQLFGIHHPPTGGSPRTLSVVICNPFGREYLRAHRSLRELAARLAHAGFHTLRFDYYGCGDSAGGCEEGNLSQWLRDTSIAIEEILEMSECRKVALVGLRLGAAIAAGVSRERRDVEHLVLWDPVVNGPDHLEELRHIQRDWEQAHPAPPSADGPEDEIILGFPLTRTLLGEIEAIDLLQAPPEAKRALVVSGSDVPVLASLQDRLSSSGIACDRQSIPSARFWLRQESINRATIPRETILYISEWASAIGR